MGDTTSIEWTDRTWNPVTGCTKVSPGCDNCYAETIASRFAGTAAFPHGFDVQVRPGKVNEPLTWRKPARVFVNSMSDLFHADVPEPWLADIFAVMAAASKHTFQVLTKRHGRMRSLLNDTRFAEHVRARATGKGLPADQWRWPLPNVWIGVSVEDQQWADIRIPALLDTPAAVRFLSCEPLLGQVDLDDHLWTPCPCCKGEGHQDCDGCAEAQCSTGNVLGLHWVIAGGESGPKARPVHPQWVEQLRDQCRQNHVPFFFKQWGEWAPTGWLVIGSNRNGCLLVGDPVDDLGHRVEMHRIGKKQAGRELDGRTWDQFPQGGRTR